MKKTRVLGRPKGKEQSLVINVRMPESLLDRLDRYVDFRQANGAEVINRAIVIRELLESFLEQEGVN